MLAVRPPSTNTGSVDSGVTAAAAADAAPVAAPDGREAAGSGTYTVPLVKSKHWHIL